MNERDYLIEVVLFVEENKRERERFSPLLCNVHLVTAFFDDYKQRITFSLDQKGIKRA